MLSGKTAEARAIVLAAGQGKRLQSEQHALPKVLRTIEDKPLLSYVLDSLDFLPPERVMLVVGFRWQDVIHSCNPAHPYVLQEKQLGTGHAVAQAHDWIAAGEGPVLCCYGDMPLIRRSTYEGLIETHLRQGAACTLLAYHTELELAYGRILRRPDGSFDSVVEDRDCTPAQKNIREYNAGVYVFDPHALLEGLEQLRPDNSQGEYYLTDVPGFLRARGDKVALYASQGRYECLGVNTREDLDWLSELVRKGRDL